MPVIDSLVEKIEIHRIKFIKAANFAAFSFFLIIFVLFRQMMHL